MQLFCIVTVIQQCCLEMATVESEVEQKLRHILMPKHLSGSEVFVFGTHEAIVFFCKSILHKSTTAGDSNFEHKGAGA